MSQENATRYFSSTYGEARKRFRDAAQSTNAELVSFENPKEGVAGERLFSEVALLGPMTGVT